MAEVKFEQPETQGIKLFGKTIVLDVKVKVEDHTANLPSNDKNEDDDHDDSSQESNLEKKRPDKVVACPRCKSMDTKFCYFNNYNVNQPRHFCKGCQRYWTAGGALRNVPVGAGRRKAKPGPTHLPSAADINSLFGAGVAVVHNDQCLVDGAVFQEYWAHHQRQHLQATGRDGFHPDFPAKRRRINDSAGQTNC